MLPIIAPPVRPGHHPESVEPESLPLTPLYLLWLGLGFTAVQILSPASLAFLHWDLTDRYLVILGLSLPAFLSKRPLAQPIGAFLIGYVVLSSYLDYLHQGQLPS